MSEVPRGALKPGTVGTLGSGRLVFVERVTIYAAFIISLPEQIIDGQHDRVRSTGASQASAISPYDDFYEVDIDSLSDLNRKFIENGCKSPIPEKYTPAPSTKPAKLNPEGSVIKRGGEKRLRVVRVPDGLDHRATIIYDIVKELKRPMLEQVVQAALQHPKFQSPSSHRAARWFANELVKLGMAEYVE